VSSLSQDESAESFLFLLVLECGQSGPSSIVSYTAGNQWMLRVFCVEEGVSIRNNFVQYVCLMEKSD
jgi:hypothetical protein